MFVYGPIPSRRLGSSLGVNLVPFKTCTYSCIYCQLGRTTNLQIKRDCFYPKEEIFDEIIRVFSVARPDYITFIGDGEPTLYRYLGWLIRQLKMTLKASVAVVTNGSLLYRKDVRQDLELADVVIPSLDAGDARLFNKINRPHPGIYFHSVVNGLIEFRHVFPGKIWLEVMLVKGVNDTPDALSKIKGAIEQIAPDHVYLLTPIRPPAEKWVKAPGSESVARAAALFSGSIPMAEFESVDLDLRRYHNARDAILSIGRHHPLRREQTERIASHYGESGLLNLMITNRELTEVRHNDQVFLIPNADEIKPISKIEE